MAWTPRTHKVDGAAVDVKFMVLGYIANNVYLIDDGEGVIVVDPSASPEAIMAAAGDRKVDAIFCTHNHADHVGALAAVKHLSGAPVYASTIDAPLIEKGQQDPSGLSAPSCKVDVKLRDGDTVTVGKTTWKVLLTPGHTKGGICFYLEKGKGTNPKGRPVLVAGDTLFCASIGRTDLPGGSMSEMRKSLRRLSQLPDSTIVLPGHNSLTSIQAEQKRVFAYFL